MSKEEREDIKKVRDSEKQDQWVRDPVKLELGH